MTNALRRSTARCPPARDTIIARLDYDPATGCFRWKQKLGSRASGQVAGTVNGAGYVIIYIDGHGFRAHQLAWLVVHCEWPSSAIDHIDHDRANNRIANLREATRQQNMANVLVSRGTMYSEHRGVTYDKSRGKWAAFLQISGKQFYLGRFETEKEAVAAYRAASIERLGEFSPFATA